MVKLLGFWPNLSHKILHILDEQIRPFHGRKMSSFLMCTIPYQVTTGGDPIPWNWRQLLRMPRVAQWLLDVVLGIIVTNIYASVLVFQMARGKKGTYKNVGWAPKNCLYG